MSEQCAFDGCDRLGAYANEFIGGELMCSLHHPAGRAHIEDRDRRIGALRDALKAVVDEVEVEHPKEDCECAISGAVDFARRTLSAG